VSDEFDLIRMIQEMVGSTADPAVVLGIGDDAALLQTSPKHHLVTATDTLVAEVHFHNDTPAEALGHKALAVNLSDLAAMGARPRWALLSLTMPHADAEWLRRFVTGFSVLARDHEVSLVGGDTCRGPLSITVQVMGELPNGQALRRAGAHSGDRIAVTGTLGDAALALAGIESGDQVSASLLDCLHRPQPRVAAGIALRGLASSCIDISDGLLADLGHLAGASGLAAAVELGDLPLSDALASLLEADPARAMDLALAGGDDYELCFTYPDQHADTVNRSMAALAVPFSEIGQMATGSGIQVYRSGKPIPQPATGYRHFVG
jgi:thiamine-monophosphate kinase